MTYLISLLFALGQIGRISFLGQSAIIYLYEPVLTISVLSLFLKYKTEPIKIAVKKYKQIAIFFGVLFISYLINIPSYHFEQNVIALLYFFRLLFYFVTFFYLALHVSKQPLYNKQMVSAVMIFTALTVVFTILQYFLYPDLRNLFYLGWDPHLYRAFGTYLDTSIAAAIYGMILLFLILKFNKLNFPKQAKIALIVIYSFMGLLTYSRGFYLAMLIAFSIYLLAKKKDMYILLLILVFSLSLFLLPKKSGEGVNLLRTFSIAARLEDNTLAVSIWQKKPLLGIGYNRIRYEKERSGILNKDGVNITHSGASFPSSFLIILVTGGVIGLIAFIFVLIKLATISELSKYLIIFISLFSLWDNVLLHPFVLFLLFVLLNVERRVFNYRGNSSR